ncbi:plasmid transfer protein TraA [Streptomyces sp. EN16]|uniref:plasmid transfer protein TraA n=1 Tax=Streptomyces sp. EN16 TaxID=212773 RepID=UPI0008518240|nr:plasmid transfer protein TraA [Streptomyces sp. EN16]
MSSPADQGWTWAGPQPSTSHRPRTAPTNGTRPTSVDNSKTRTGGGFNPSIGLAVNKTVVNGKAGGSTAPGGGAGPGTGGKIPGSDFMSNEDIRAFCEYLRKESRNRATERAMDADHLEAVLRTIPDGGGSLHGARARARRVSRWLKKVAAAEKNIQKYSAMIYGTFEREYESDLRKVGKGRTQQPRPTKFGWR